MATVKPFAALRPDPALAARICELPYDVFSSAEARAVAAGNTLSFLHASKPEIDLPPETGLYDERVYAQGRKAFLELIAKRALIADREPAFYLYRQVMGEHSQLGLVGLASCDEYVRNVIKKHELTRPDKENDRVHHIESLNAQTGPAFLVWLSEPLLEERLSQVAQEPPEIDFIATDDIRHSSWSIRDPAEQRFIQERFAKMPSLYIADGHHRTAAAARIWQKRRSPATAGFLSVLFPHTQVQILPYNRLVKDLNGLTPQAFLERLERVGTVRNTGVAKPVRKNEVSFYLASGWQTLTFLPDRMNTTDPIERLDATLLQKQVLAPLLGIDDPRTSERIGFVGGIRGTAELERLVGRDEYACAFSMFPTGIGDLIDVADAGGIMPPKSTWFEPKLRDGMFSHMLD